MAGSKLAPGPTAEDLKRASSSGQSSGGVESTSSQPQRQSKLLPLPSKLPTSAISSTSPSIPTATSASTPASNPSPRPRSDSTSSHSSSSTDTTEAEERDRLAALGPPPRPIHQPIFSLLSILSLLLLAHISGLYLFSSGFLLTRRELNGISTCDLEVKQNWSPPSPPASFQKDQRDEKWYKEWEKTLSSSRECTLPPKFSKTIFFLIDALRWDMISPIPVDPSSNSNSNSNSDSDFGHSTNASTFWKPDPNLHGQLTLPSELHSSGKGSSFLAHFLADAPTTTLQRLKGLTTGTLPTFIDAGSNFGATNIEEDNWLNQLKLKLLKSKAGDEYDEKNSNSGIALMGDDTWTSIFPNLFDDRMSWPFSSFNVEDLDTVDNGVREKLLTLLDPNFEGFNQSLSQDWKLLIAHTLGVDHVGHRFGASHPKMATKLKEMNELISNVIELMDDDTLFVLLGDHGMDQTGDHGGDGELEVGAGIWIYSKLNNQISTSSTDEMDSLKSILRDQEDTLELIPNFQPFTPLPSPPFDLHRSVPQIDLVPTLSLLLGLPIPFNSLGSIIPEIFHGPQDKDRLLRSYRINSFQLRQYLSDYQTKSSDLNPVYSQLEEAWKQALISDAEYSAAFHQGNQILMDEKGKQTMKLYHRFLRLSLLRAREVWAQFDQVKMVMGIFASLIALITTGLLRSASEKGLKKAPSTGSRKVEKGLKPEKKMLKGKKLFLSKSKRSSEKEVRTDGTEELASEFLKHLKFGAFFGFALAMTFSIMKFLPLQDLPLPWNGIFNLNLSNLDVSIFFPVISSQINLIWKQRDIFRSSRPFQTRSSDEDIDDDDDSDHVLDEEGEKSTNPLSFTNFSKSLSILRSNSSSRTFTLLGFSLPVIHSALFGSNSFTVWEDRTVLVLFSTAITIRLIKSFGSQTSRLRNRLPFLALLILISVRIMSHHTVCREEQAPWCSVTFYENSNPNPTETNSTAINQSDTGGVTGPKLNSPLKILISYLTAYFLPFIISRFLNISKSFSGPAPFFLNWLIRPTLLAGSGYWLADWMGNSPSMESFLGSEIDGGDHGVKSWLNWSKLNLARADLTILCVAGSIYWLLAPLCLNLREEPIEQASNSSQTNDSSSSNPTTKDGPRTRVIVHGFSNSLGASHLLFSTLIFSLLFLVSQPSGQISLALGFVAFIALLELGDGERDDRLMRESILIRERLNSRKIEGLDKKSTTQPSTGKTISDNLVHQLNLNPPLPTMIESTTIGLLCHLLFFTTGHQATLSSIQWRSAFIGVSKVTYPISPILVVLNSFGPFLLLPGILLPLISTWNLPPVPRGPPGTRAPQRMKTLLSILRSSMGLILYFGLVSFSATVFAAHFKRHLMLFKIWTPRFMLAATGLIGIQVSIMIGVIVAGIVAGKVTTTFGSEFA